MLRLCCAGQSSPSQVHSPKSITSPTNGNKLENHRSKFASANIVQKCNNCVKNNQNERPGLLQTPISPIRSGQALQHSPKSTNLAPCGQNNQHKSEQRRPNTLNICNNQCSAQCGNTLSVSRPGSRHKLRHQNSSQGSYDSISPCLSRGMLLEQYAFFIFFLNPFPTNKDHSATNLIGIKDSCLDIYGNNLHSSLC